MGRELCISLTAVVLEAINTVEQAQLQSHSSESQQKPLQLNDPNDQSMMQQQQPQPRPKRAVTAEKRRPSSERFSRDAIAAESLKVGARARAGSECNGKPQRRGAAGDRGVAVEGTFHKEDPGLKDLDQREEEFRKVRYDAGCVAGILMEEFRMALTVRRLSEECFRERGCPCKELKTSNNSCYYS